MFLSRRGANINADAASRLSIYSSRQRRHRMSSLTQQEHQQFPTERPSRHPVHTEPLTPDTQWYWPRQSERGRFARTSFCGGFLETSPGRGSVSIRWKCCEIWIINEHTCPAIGCYGSASSRAVAWPPVETHGRMFWVTTDHKPICGGSRQAVIYALICRRSSLGIWLWNEILLVSVWWSLGRVVVLNPPRCSSNKATSWNYYLLIRNTDIVIIYDIWILKISIIDSYLPF